MKTTRSAFSGFPRDRYTTLADTDDRLMATKITAIWRYGAPDLDFDAVWTAARATLLEVFADHDSPSVQTSIWIMAKAMLERHEELDEVRMVLPNLHHWTVDLSPFGIDQRQAGLHLHDRAPRPHRGDGPPQRGVLMPAARRALAVPPGVEVTGPAVPGSERVLTQEALAFIADLQRRFGAAAPGPPASPPRAPGGARRGRAAGLPGRDPRDPRGGLDRGAGTGRLRRPAGRDHRAGRAQDDDQRPELRGARLHGRPRGRALADLGERRRRAGGAHRRRPRHARVRRRPRASRTGSASGSPSSSCGHAAGTWSSRTCSSTACRSRRRCSMPGCTCSTTPPSGSRAAPGRTSTCPSSSRTTRRGSGTRSSSTPQDALGVPRGSIRATVLIETITAAFEMDEILYELREHAAGLNAGPLGLPVQRDQEVPRRRPSSGAPDRSQLTMTVPFMRAYTELLVQTCHRRGAHAIGGMAAFIPNRRDPEVTETALAKVRDDKERESRDGFDGTWVAHPDLVPLATEIFDAVLGDAPNQKGRMRDEVPVDGRGAAGPRGRGRRPSPRPASGRTSGSRSPTSTRGCAGPAPPRSTTSWRTPRPPRSPARSSGCGGPAACSPIEQYAADPRRGAGPPGRRRRRPPQGRLGRARPPRPRRRLRRVPDAAGLPAARLSAAAPAAAPTAVAARAVRGDRRSASRLSQASRLRACTCPAAGRTLLRRCTSAASDRRRAAVAPSSGQARRKRLGPGVDAWRGAPVESIEAIRRQLPAGLGASVVWSSAGVEDRLVAARPVRACGLDASAHRVDSSKPRWRSGVSARDRFASARPATRWAFGSWADRPAHWVAGG